MLRVHYAGSEKFNSLRIRIRITEDSVYINLVICNKRHIERNLVLRRQTDNRQFSAPAHGSQCGLQCRRIPRCFPGSINASAIRDRFDFLTGILFPDIDDMRRAHFFRGI